MQRKVLLLDYFFVFNLLTLPLSHPTLFLPVLSQLCACESLGYHVLRRIQQGAVTSVWSVVCIQLAQFLHAGRWSVPLSSLVEEVAWLIGILKRTGAAVALEG